MSRLKRLQRLESVHAVHSDVQNVVVCGHESAGPITSLESKHGLVVREPGESEAAFFNRAYSHVKAKGVTLWAARHE